MKHIREYDSFEGDDDENQVKIDLIQDNSLDVDNRVLTVYYEQDGWDSYSKYEKDLKLLARNMNDPMSEDIDYALRKYHLKIDTQKKHALDINSGSIDFNLCSAPFISTHR